jgi:GH15 family glucan-1,4-alpha-glucosidase
MLLKVDTPFGSCWRRYNHDGYGQRHDGGPLKYWGTGRPWPLLTGERGTTKSPPEVMLALTSAPSRGSPKA